MCIPVILLMHELQDIFEAEPNVVREDDSSVQRIIARLLVKISRCEITQFREDYDTALRIPDVYGKYLRPMLSNSFPIPSEPRMYCPTTFLSRSITHNCVV